MSKSIWTAEMQEEANRASYAEKRWHAWLTAIGIPPVFEAMKDDHSQEALSQARVVAKTLPFNDFAVTWETQNPYQEFVTKLEKEG